jgi:hypothetical protein
VSLIVGVAYSVYGSLALNCHQCGRDGIAYTPEIENRAEACAWRSLA